MQNLNSTRPPSRQPKLTKEDAESMAIEVLSFLAGEPERLGRFMALCGLGPENLRSAAQEPGFLAAVLDHLAGDESLLLAFAAHSGHDPSDIARAREILSPRVELP